MPAKCALHALGRHVPREPRIVARIERDERDVRRVALVAGARVSDRREASCHGASILHRARAPARAGRTSDARRRPRGPTSSRRRRPPDRSCTASRPRRRCAAPPRATSRPRRDAQRAPRTARGRADERSPCSASMPIRSQPQSSGGTPVSRSRSRDDRRSARRAARHRARPGVRDLPLADVAVPMADRHLERAGRARPVAPSTRTRSGAELADARPR